MSILNKKQEGFTLVELLVATTVFSLILLVATTGIVQLGRLYYRGITDSKTQEVTRAVFEDVSRSVQFAKGQRRDVPSALLPAGVTQFCIGDTRYSYSINEKVTSSSSTGLRITRISPTDNCPGPVAGQQMLDQNMRLLDLRVAQVGSGNGYDVLVKIAYGDNDLLSHYPDNATDATAPTGPIPTAQCKTGVSGSSFCAVAQLNTIIKKRLID